MLSGYRSCFRCLRKSTDRKRRITEKTGTYYPDFKLFLKTQSSTLRSTLFEKPSNVDQRFLKKCLKSMQVCMWNREGAGTWVISHSTLHMKICPAWQLIQTQSSIVALISTLLHFFYPSAHWLCFSTSKRFSRCRTLRLLSSVALCMLHGKRFCFITVLEDS